jgi:hypothetical protein
MKHVLQVAVLAAGFAGAPAFAAPIGEITITANDNMSNTVYTLCSISSDFGLHASGAPIEAFCGAAIQYGQDLDKESYLCRLTAEADRAVLRLKSAKGEITEDELMDGGLKISETERTCDQANQEKRYNSDALQSLFREHIGESITLTLSSP